MLVLLSALTAGSVGAQTITVESLTGLAFQTIAGEQTLTVHPSDPDAAKFHITRSGLPGALVLLSFSLPSIIETDGGTTLAVAFGPASAAWAGEDGGTQTVFDPSQGLTVTVPLDGDFYVWIGGTATSTSGQASGDYDGTLTLTVVNP